MRAHSPAVARDVPHKSHLSSTSPSPRAATPDASKAWSSLQLHRLRPVGMRAAGHGRDGSSCAAGNRRPAQRRRRARRRCTCLSAWAAHRHTRAPSGAAPTLRSPVTALRPAARLSSERAARSPLLRTPARLPTAELLAHSAPGQATHFQAHQRPRRKVACAAGPPVQLCRAPATPQRAGVCPGRHLPNRLRRQGALKQRRQLPASPSLPRRRSPLTPPPAAPPAACRHRPLLAAAGQQGRP